jgi:hypothetical protein
LNRLKTCAKFAIEFNNYSGKNQQKIMGRKVNYAEKPKKGPGKKTKKQPAPKFPAKLLGKGKNSKIVLESHV